MQGPSRHPLKIKWARRSNFLGTSRSSSATHIVDVRSMHNPDCPIPSFSPVLSESQDTMRLPTYRSSHGLRHHPYPQSKRALTRNTFVVGLSVCSGFPFFNMCLYSPSRSLCIDMMKSVLGPKGSNCRMSNGLMQQPIILKQLFIQIAILATRSGGSVCLHWLLT
ncbi:hypothetical protein PILCRDRAFT_201608 [Piloderma croceum F 1598]|uniref:Uncharacterized protein n=1 Tax=Piloderma croceum (strain F 1598) TaxID=765440 RepID=A0A0C3BTP8_PILCF|nr:hypothetical protein PILCRDRAFT_201608 [Piloderma croceum F 1598]